MTLFWADISFKNIAPVLILCVTQLPFSTPRVPSHFLVVWWYNLDADCDDNCSLSELANYSFTIPALFNFNAKSYTDGETSELRHRYSVFGTAELVKVSSDATIPVRMINPSSQPVIIFRKPYWQILNRLVMIWQQMRLAKIPLPQLRNL